MAAPALFPTVAPYVELDGASIVFTLDQNNCLPPTGAGRFTIAGATPAPGPWAMESALVFDAQLQAMTVSAVRVALVGRILAGQTITASYTRANDAGDVTNAGAEALANFAGVAVDNTSLITAAMNARTARLPSHAFHPWLL